MNLGILSLTLPSASSYLRDIVISSNDTTVQAVVVLTKDIAVGEKSVRAYHWNERRNDWESDVIPLPTLWYDRCLYGEDTSSIHGRETVKQLKTDRAHTFLGYGLPDKYRLYEQLRIHPILRKYLVPTVLLEELFQLEELLATHEEWIMKPVNGAHGFAIYAIQQKKDGTVRVQTTKKGFLKTVYVPSLTDFYQWFNHLFSQFTWILQPRIPSVNKEKQPIDFRIFLQKDSHGEWQTVLKGVRIGEKNGILTNLSSGASAHSFIEWKERVPEAYANLVEEQLTECLRLLPIELEGAFHPLFELGVDVLLLPNGEIRLLDINSKPGRKILSLLSETLYEAQKTAPLLYAAHLLSLNVERS